jgi:hypothetical protein
MQIEWHKLLVGKIEKLLAYSHDIGYGGCA